jgi:hypothetical protein
VTDPSGERIALLPQRMRNDRRNPMSNVSSSDSDQTPVQSEQDRVFNAETCRALRKEGYEAARVLVPTFTVVLFFFVAALQGVVSVLSPWRELLVGVALSVVFTVTLIAELRWFDVSLDRETIREAWTEMSRDLRREAREYAGDPEAIEARVLEDATDPNARPELAFGLPPEDCFIVFIVPVAGMVLAISVPSLPISVLILGLTITFSGVRIVHINTFGKPNTYSPENPPHDRQRGRENQ